jgi:hypothetical protein
MRRRAVVFGGLTAGLVACSSARSTPGTSVGAPPAIMPAMDPGEGPLSVTIEYQGDTYLYSDVDGTDLGDYIDPAGRFVQRCIRTTNQQLPLTVFFRPDRDTHRAEVVFELGRIRPKTPPANLDSYTVTIKRGDRAVFTARIPNHYWFSRWRWQSSPRPVTADTSKLIASGLLPHYDKRATKGTARSTPRFSYQIMGLAGLSPVMPATGERDDIGPVTEIQAEFICTGNEAALATVLAQAEGAGTLPWYLRDESTGAPIDVLRHPKASLYSPELGDPYIAAAKTPIQLDTNHEPAVAYLPFLLTGDPYHLETIQFQVTYDYVALPGTARYSTGQVRGQAWLLRTLGQAAAATPEKAPRWLMPRRYFQELLADKLNWINRSFVLDAAPPRAVFRSMEQAFSSRPEGEFDAGTLMSPWMEEFMAFVLCWLVQMGNADWEPVARWKIGSTVARTNGTSGWVRVRPTPYRIALKQHANSPWLTSWGDAWALNSSSFGWKYNDADRLDVGRDITYPSYTRGALAMAARLDLPEARACFNWIDPQLRAHLRGGVRMEYKWSVVA